MKTRRASTIARVVLLVGGHALHLVSAACSGKAPDFSLVPSQEAPVGTSPAPASKDAGIRQPPAAPFGGDGGAGSEESCLSGPATGCSCPTEGATVPCWTGPAETRGIGACKDGVMQCVAEGEFLRWSACVGEVLACEVEDAGRAADASDASDAAACPGGPLGGIGIPRGSRASASSALPSFEAERSIDGDLTTRWNAGSQTGWIRVDFTEAQSVSGVRIATGSDPTSNETFTLLGYKDGQVTTIGSYSGRIATKSNFAVSVTPGIYDALRIDIASTLSWVGVFDISLVTTSCP